ncbi:MoxR-like ATPase [Dictyobacter arantiisoli]|uniref:MoxR-like ATPase n=2 Tax=Dictyobacter arantiisoli TaxID=2014874 RepID=A0A5A5TF76_9CHLR|nr:AAA family ATPase [Dictyobacter arantiisoli]GCF09659.1 MoxR-like ATPase [Dictyobacter arantiisoli]
MIHPQPQRSAPPGPSLAPVQPSPIEPVLFEVKRLIVGQDHLLERLLVALLARGHVLLEGVPGLAKTATIKALAQVIGGKFGRVQFTPDLVPADLIGTRIYNAKNAEFMVELGPIFVNLLLADEINRAPAKVQSALLEVMQEHQVTIGKETHRIPDPFLVLATQNPIESDGTYPLPEAQLDRFMFKVLVDYPSYEDEVVIVERMTGVHVTLRTLLSSDQLREFQQRVDQIYVDPHVVFYAATLVHATREPERHGLGHLKQALLYGGSPRASINLVAGARALAFLRGRHYVLPRDVADLALDVLRHRMVFSYEAAADGVTADTIVADLLQRFPPPQIDLGDNYVA